MTRVDAQENAACELGELEHSQVLGRLKKAWVFYRYLVDCGTANNAPPGIRILYAKISNCLVSILHLLRQGYPGPAVMVLRSLFEAHVHLSVILEKDVLNCSILFENFLHIEWESTYPMADAKEEWKRKHQETLAAIRSNYHPDKPRTWCWAVVQSKRKDKKGIPENPSFRDLCEHIGQLDNYQMVYGRFSAAIHTVPSYGSWISREDGVTMEMGPQFSSRTEEVGNLTIGLSMASFSRVVRFLKPHDAKELLEYVLKETGLADFSRSDNQGAGPK